MQKYNNKTVMSNLASVLNLLQPSLDADKYWEMVCSGVPFHYCEGAEQLSIGYDGVERESWAPKFFSRILYW